MSSKIEGYRCPSFGLEIQKIPHTMARANVSEKAINP
jgi:hypothetical protein